MELQLLKGRLVMLRLLEQQVKRELDSALEHLAELVEKKVITDD